MHLSDTAGIGMTVGRTGKWTIRSSLVYLYHLGCLG